MERRSKRKTESSSHSSTSVSAISTNDQVGSPRKRKSMVWNSFTIFGDGTKAKCNLCSQLISRGGIGKLASTTSLRKHLHSKHREVFDKDIENEQSSTLNSNNLSTSQDSKRPNLPKIFDNTALWDPDNPKAMSLHYSTGEMLALDGLPYSRVEDIGFMRLINVVQPRYEIPVQTFFREEIMPDISSRLRFKINSKLQNTKWISLTGHVSVSHQNCNKLLIVSAHWIDKGFELSHAVLEVKHFLENDYIPDLVLIINNLLNSYNVNVSKIHLAFNNLNQNSLNGFNQIPQQVSILCEFQMLLNGIILSQPCVADLFSQARGMTNNFQKSSRFWDGLIEKPDIEGRNIDLLSCKEVYKFFHYFIKQKLMIESYFNEMQHLVFTPYQWDLLATVTSILEGFDKAFDSLSSSKSLVSEIIPTITELKQSLDESLCFNNYEVNNLRASLAKSLQAKLEEYRINENFLVSIFLDLRFKNDYLSTNDVTLIKDFILCQSSIDKSQLKSELDSFSTEQSISKSENPLFWWKEHGNNYAILSDFVLKYLSAPASTICNDGIFNCSDNSERLFRMMVEGKIDTNLLFVRYNLPFCYFDY